MANLTVSGVDVDALLLEVAFATVTSAVLVAVVFPETADAVMVDVPADIPVTKPDDALTVATDALPDDQVTVVVAE